ncbi:MAG: hypothetical protein HDS88_00910 [Bacteroidales bacterium]|nr:hypothetical protein [Bacteroidales bacterium]
MNKFSLSLLFFTLIIEILSAQQKAESPYAVFGDKTPVLGATDTKPVSSEIVLIVFSNDTILSAVNADQNELILRNNKGDTLSVYSINPADYAIFTSPDPKYAEMPGYSHYSNCFGNPVNLVDLNGERPSGRSSALMAQHVYNDKYKKRNEDLLYDDHWEPLTIDESSGLTLNADGLFSTGLQSEIFKRTIDGKTEYAYVFAGTNSIRDAEQDIAQIAGLSAQYSMAINNAKKFVESVKGCEVTFVGHSLGAGESAAASMATGCAAICFNPATVSPLTKLFKSLDSSNANITNYITVSPNSKWGGCIVNKIQDALKFSAPGTRINIPVSTKDPLKAHEIRVIVDYFLDNNVEN